MSSASKDESALYVFEAGLTPKTPRTISCCKRFLLGSGLITLVASGLGIAYVATNIAYDLAKPHRGLYYKEPLDGKGSGRQVVRPLVSREQTFDIAVTVWVRTKNEQAAKHQEEDGRRTSIWTVKAPPVTPLYSDIVFRGLRLTDKNVFATVNFTLPTAYFKNSLLTNYDLRGSIVLIPTSPSLLDHIVDYSTWIPDIVDTLPVRSWPFPLGSPDKGKKTLADMAVNSFGVTVPLIQFHRIRSRCDPGGLEDFAYEFEEEDKDFLEQLKRGSLLEMTEGKAVLSHHPYIVTRTQIRVVDETRLFKKHVYNNKFRHVRHTSCGQQRTLQPTAFMCDRTYSEVGHVETQMTLAVPHEETKQPEIAWAYSPYISVTKSAVGPKDLVRIPVDREGCLAEEEEEDELSDPKDTSASIDVSWKLSFSGRPYHKLFIAEATEAGLGRQSAEDVTGSEHYQTLGQNAVELAHGVAGIRHSEDAHPRRRVLISALQVILALAVTGLDVMYWFTRTTNVAISIPGTLIRAGSLAIEQLAPAIAAAQLQNKTAMDWALTAMWNILELSTEFLMVQAVSGIRTKWGKGASWRKWLPVVYRVPGTHAERASQRLDAQISHWTKDAILTLLFIIYYFLAPHNYAVLAPLLPEPHPADYPQSWLNEAWPYLVWPMDVAGKIFQILLNWQSQKFAGSYKATAILILVLRAFGFLEYVPMLVGRYDARPILVAHAFVDFALLAVLAWQALTLPRVEQKEEALHSE